MIYASENYKKIVHGRWSTVARGVVHCARICTELLNESQETARAVVHCCTDGGPLLRARWSTTILKEKVVFSVL